MPQIQSASSPLHKGFLATECMEVEEAAVVGKTDNDEAVAGAIGKDELMEGTQGHREASS